MALCASAAAPFSTAALKKQHITCTGGPSRYGGPVPLAPCRRSSALNPNGSCCRAASATTSRAAAVCHASLVPPSADSRHRPAGSTLVIGDACIRPAQPAEYWPAADLHCKVYGHDDDPARLGGMLARIDRILAMQINDRLAEEGSGSSALLVLYGRDAPAASEPAAAIAAAPREPSASLEFPSPMYWLSNVLQPNVRPGIGVSAEACQLLGVAAVDTFGDLVPPRELDARRDGAFGWRRRTGFCYISNVAVLPSARRQGVARRLVAMAEQLAAQWGCRAAGLHCNPRKVPAQALYDGMGYRRTVLEPAIMPYIQGRAPDRCVFMLKRLPAAAGSSGGSSNSGSSSRGGAGSGRAASAGR